MTKLSSARQPSSNSTLVDKKNVVSGVVVFAAGVYVVWEAQKFEGTGASMPLFVGCGLITLAVLLIATAFVKPALLGSGKNKTGAMWPRLFLTAIMIAWVISLPIVGFLISSSIAFSLIALTVPKSEQQNFRFFIVHSLGGILVTFFFWYCLTVFLNVPLPYW